MDILAELTELGDMAVILPALMVLTALLLRSASWRAAAWLVGTTASCAVIIISLKLAFGACSDSWGVGIRSPSGHAAMSTLFYGALGVIATKQTNRLQALGFLLLIAVVIVGIAISRVSTHAHNASEVIIGLLLGGIALGVFARQCARAPAPEANIALLIGLPILAVLAMAGRHLDLEWLLRQAGLAMNLAGHLCP